MDPLARRRYLVVAALIIGADGRVLLTQRREDQSGPLGWEFPGGKIEAGEAPEAALVREIDEELGARIRVGRIWDVVFHAYPDYDVYMLVYRCELELGQAARPIEVRDLRWLEPAELGELAVLPADAPLVARLMSEGPGAA